MKRIKIALHFGVFVFSICHSIIAQDVLNTNSNPAFTILGIASSEIQRPSNVGEFTAALQNATQEFSALPSTFGVEILPWKILHGDYDYKNTNFFKGATVSFAYNGDNVNPTNGISFPSIGLGFNIGWRKKCSSEVSDNKKSKVINLYKDYFDFSTMQIHEYFMNTQNLLQSSEEVNKDTLAPFSRLTIALQNGNTYLEDEIAKNKSYYPEGLFLDFSIGAIRDYNENNINDGKWTRWGAWLKTGYEHWSNILSGLIIVRYQSDKEMMVDMGGQDIRQLDGIAWDMGARVILESKNRLFSLSGEYVWRNRTAGIIGNSRKWQIQMSANIGGNSTLGFTFGKDFEENIIREGNLISLLSFVNTFGTEKNKK